MNIQQASEYIRALQPKYIHLSGKTSTGKSTLAGQWHEAFGYEIITLDEIVRSAVIDKYQPTDEGQVFIEVYKQRDRLDLIDSFVQAAREKVATAQANGYPVILDGAIANIQTLKQLLDESMDTIIYLHPANLANYRRNLMSRFKTATPSSQAGLPATFWSLIDEAAFARFCASGEIGPETQQAIEHYAVVSQTESLKRIADLKASFKHVTVVDI